MIEKISAWKTSDGTIYTTHEDAIKAELSTKFSEWYCSDEIDRLKINGNVVASDTIFDWIYEYQDIIIKLIKSNI
jgi:hypothetical protein